jgi:hypothetical protein
MKKGITMPSYTERLIAQFDQSDYDDVRLIIFKQVLDYIGEDMVREIYLSHDMAEYEE